MAFGTSAFGVKAFGFGAFEYPQSTLDKLKAIGGLTFYKDFTQGSSVNADYAAGSATGTFARNDDATHPSAYIDSNGNIQLGSKDVPRWCGGYYDSTGFHAAKGILLESSAANLLYDSYFLDGSATYWIANGTGTVTNDSTYANIYAGGKCQKIVSAAQYDGMKTSVAKHPTFVSGKKYAVRALVQGTGTAMLYMLCSGGVAQYGTPVTLSSSIKELSTVFIADASAVGDIGVVSNDGASTIYVYIIQCEGTGTTDSPFPTSWIPTKTSAGLSKRADILSYLIASNRTAAQETIFIQFMPFGGDFANNSVLRELISTQTKNRTIRNEGDRQTIGFFPNVSDSSTKVQRTDTAIQANVSYVIAGTCKNSPSSYGIALDGIQEGDFGALSWTSPAWGTNFYLGSSNGGTGSSGLYGIIQKIAIFNRVFTPGEMKVVSNLLNTKSNSYTPAAIGGLNDTNATTETSALYTTLKNAMGSRIYYGYQLNGSTESVNASLDVYKITGRYPGLIGKDYRWNDAGQTASLITHANAGGLLTISWHADNFSTGGSYSDMTGNPVTAILPGGAKRADYLTALDNLATWLSALVDSNGHLIPVLWRPFQEADLIDSFWWNKSATGGSGGSDAQYVALWQDMYTYLTVTKGVHNLIWVYSPEITNGYDYDGARYPGDAYVDVFGIDRYSQSTDLSATVEKYRKAYDCSSKHGKVFAITEGMWDQVITLKTDFWTCWINAILGDPKIKKAAYFMDWYSPDWGPLYGRGDATNFLNMSNTTGVTFRP
jgi:beta-mannanase